MTTPLLTLDSPERVLLVRPSALGDVARSVWALATLRAAWPEARIDWLVARENLDVVRAHPGLSGVVGFDRRSWWKVPGLLGRLLTTRYDAAIDVQGLLRSAGFARAASRECVGMSIAREGASRWYRHTVEIPEGLHAVERELRLLEGMGLARVEDATLTVPAESCGFFDRVWAEDERILTGQAQGIRHERVLAIAPFTRWGCKNWPTERFIALAHQLVQKGRVDRVVSLGSDADQVRVEAVLEDWPDQDFADRVMQPSTTVGEMMDVIACSDVLVCNDSGPLHLAVGLGTPTVSIFGPTDPALVGPYVPAGSAEVHRVLRPAGAAVGRNRHRELGMDNTLMRGVTVAEVLEAVEASLGVHT